MGPFLDKLKSNGKSLFLITNSPFELVDSGMTLIIGPSWQDLFDVIIVSAKKPSFFTHQFRHLREYNPDKEILSWNEVNRIVPGKIYSRVRGIVVLSL